METPTTPPPRLHLKGLSPRPAFLLLGLAAACFVSCGKLPGQDGKSQKPTPPPPAERVPNAPGPDNTIKEMPADPAPAEKSSDPVKPTEPAPEPPREGDR